MCTSPLGSGQTCTPPQKSHRSLDTLCRHLRWPYHLAWRIRPPHRLACSPHICTVHFHDPTSGGGAIRQSSGCLCWSWCLPRRHWPYADRWWVFPQKEQCLQENSRTGLHAAKLESRVRTASTAIMQTCYLKHATLNKFQIGVDWPCGTVTYRLRGLLHISRW